MKPEIVQHQAQNHAIHDPQWLDPLPPWLFDPGALRARKLITGSGAGRKPAWFFQLAGKTLVLRHYWRGGLVARFVSDSYLWTGLDRTRPFREWRLLACLRARGLPVPAPVAARALRHGALYRADLVTVAIPDTIPLDQRLRHTEIGTELWKHIGATIGRFHAAGACHADLNVRNILLDTEDNPWLIDWDQGGLRRPDPAWQRSNLDRLRRSLDKDPVLAEAAGHGWEAFLCGHASTRNAPTVLPR